jgi:hypothetical protein
VPTLSVLNALPGEAARARADSVLDVPHGNVGARERFSRPGPFPVAALEWRPDSTPTRPAPLTFTVREHVGWLADEAEVADADPADVVKQVSFLQASSTVTPEEFRSHYRDHVGVARRHMPNLWQYVQYDVTGVAASAPDLVRAAAGFTAVSVLWFRSTDDFLNRYFASAEDEAEFRSHEGFLDLSRAFTFVARADPATARP